MCEGLHKIGGARLAAFVFDHSKRATRAVRRASRLLLGHPCLDIVSNFLLDVFPQFFIEFGIQLPPIKDGAQQHTQFRYPTHNLP
jgi:hypothetical protein